VTSSSSIGVRAVVLGHSHSSPCHEVKTTHSSQQLPTVGLGLNGPVVEWDLDW
jgi:hypothetical protein